MSLPDVSCGLEYTITQDLQACLTEALQNSYSFIVTPVIHPRFSRQHYSKSDKIGGFTRSDMVLSNQDWTSRVVGKLTPHLNVDSTSPLARQRHEDWMYEELLYSTGLGLCAIMLPLHGSNSSNLARILLSYYATSHHPSQIWIQVPMVCRRTLRNTNPDNDSDDETAWNETWYWWSRFHELLEWDKRVGIVLELSADAPSRELAKRWLGEPVKAIVVPTSLFHNNKKGYPVLSRMHQEIVISMVEHDAQVIISGASRHDVKYYLQYIQRLWLRRPHAVDDPMLNYAKGWEDYLQTPLQPLADNLDTYTYNVFEKDPVKYDQYQKAIALALTHLKTKEKQGSRKHKTVINTLIQELGQGDALFDDDEQPFTVMVLGAGRGPLVRATFNAADLTNTKVKVIAVEKNPCAVVVLAAQVREVWRDRDVTVVPGDMRHLNLSPKADIIVSELLGSWGDNELSPECLDGAGALLRAGGVSIPARYSSYAAPVCSPRLWAAAAAYAPTASNHLKDKNLETLWVVYMQNKHNIGETKRVFTFDHPAKSVRDHQGQEVTNWRGLPLTDNRRSATLTWVVTQDNVMHGFGGYFDCVLFGDEMISIVPSTHSPGMISWFPVFIPIKTPLRVHKGEVIKATFWRCVDSHRVWYEWIVEVNDRGTSMHNINGRSSEMLL